LCGMWMEVTHPWVWHDPVIHIWVRVCKCLMRPKCHVIKNVISKLVWKTMRGMCDTYVIYAIYYVDVVIWYVICDLSCVIYVIRDRSWLKVLNKSVRPSKIDERQICFMCDEYVVCVTNMWYVWQICGIYDRYICDMCGKYVIWDVWCVIW